MKTINTYSKKILYFLDRILISISCMYLLYINILYINLLIWILFIGIISIQEININTNFYIYLVE